MGDMVSGLVGSAVSSATSVYNSERQISSQQKSQASQNAWQSAENDRDRLWQQQEWLRQFTKQNEQWEKQFNMQNEYNDPSAVIERLRNAGINPAVAMGQLSGTGGLAAAGGSGQVSSPGQFPSHMVTPMGLQNPTSVFNPADMLRGISDLMNAKTNAKRLNLDTDYQNATLESVVEKLKADARYQDKAAALADIQASIQQAVGDKEARARISNLMAQAALFDHQGKTQQSQDALNKAITELTNTKNGIIEEAKPMLINNLSRIGRLYESEAVSNYAVAGRANAETLTINALRDGQVRGQQLSNTISEVKAALGSVEVQQAVATNPAKIEALLDSYEREKWITEEQKAKAKMAIKNKDWQTFDKILDSAESVSRTTKNVTSSLSIGKFLLGSGN